MQQTLVRTAKGRFTQYNRLHGIPEGGMLVAESVEIQREGVVSKIRGRARFGSAFPSAPKQLLEFHDRLIPHVGTSLYYDTTGAAAFSAFSGTFSPPDSSNRIRAVEALLGMYFTSSAGIYKKATLADDPVLAGIAEGLDLNASVTGTGAGMFAVDTALAYRIVFGRRDANQKLLLGAASWRQTITNPKTEGLIWTRSGAGPFTITVAHTAHGFATSDVVEILDASVPSLNGSRVIIVTGVNAYTFSVSVDPGAGGSGADTLSDGKDFNVSLNFTIPAAMVALDFYRIYRTELSASAVDEPGDEVKLVKEVALTSGNISAGTITVTDSTDSAFLDEALSTNASKRGPGLEPSRPPFSTDIALWKGHVWQPNTKQYPKRKLTLLTITGLTDGTSSISLTTSGTTKTYIFDTAENIGARKFKRYTSFGTLAENVEATAKSLCKIINRDTGQTLWEARYVSNADEAPGIIEFRKRSVNSASITFIANDATTGGVFSPSLPTVGTTIATDEEARPNFIYRSLFEEAESVPVANNDPVCSESKAILRALALRDSLVLPTEQGVYRVSGETDGLAGASFVISVLDPSIQCVAPETWCVLNNAVYGLSTQGVVRIDESGSTDIVSYPIEDELKLLFGITNYKTLAFAAAYESARQLWLCVPGAAGDTASAFAHIYTYTTNTWTTRTKAISAAHVMFTEDKLFEAHADDFFILKERKTFATSPDDYRDESIPITVTAFGTTTNSRGELVSTVTVTYGYTTISLDTGFLFEQGVAEEGIVEDFTDLGAGSFSLVLDTLINPALGAATLSLAINSRIVWRPESVGNPEVMKQFPYTQIYMEGNTALEHLIGFASDVDSAEVIVSPIRVTPGFGWGEGAWGEFGWGDEDSPPSTPLRVPVPRQFQRCRALTLVHEHRRAKERFAIASLAYSFKLYGDKTTRTPR